MKADEGKSESPQVEEKMPSFSVLALFTMMIIAGNFVMVFGRSPI